MRLKSKKAELKQRIKVSLAKYVGMFRRDFSNSIRFFFHKHKTSFCRTPKNQNTAKTPSRYSNFNLLEGLSHLNYFRGKVGKIGKQLHCILILETRIRCKI